MDEWRNKLIVCVGRSDDNFNSDKQHICMAHFEQSSLLFHGMVTIFNINVNYPVGPRLWLY